MKKINKTAAEWKKQLTPNQYTVTREKGTEPAFSGEYCNFHAARIYQCVCCGKELFNSDNKFDSGSGWPSFTAPMDKDAVTTAADLSHGMTRTEVICPYCDAHLGHVFND